MLRRLYDWILRQSASRHAVPVMCAMSFMESSFFPLPPDIMLIPMILADRRRAWWLAFLCMASSVVGAFLGYAIGYYFYTAIGEPILRYSGVLAKAQAMLATFNQYGAEIILVKGATPIPFKLVTIASGVAHLNLVTFGIAALATRGIRFLAVAGLFCAFGPQARAMIDRHFSTFMIAGTIIVILGFVAVVLI